MTPDLPRLTPGHLAYASRDGRVYVPAQAGGLVQVLPVLAGGKLVVNVYPVGPLRGPLKVGRQPVPVALLVALTWLPPRPVGCKLVHRDRDPSNCAAHNLAWLPRRHPRPPRPPVALLPATSTKE